jgi:hypothetical protein
MTSTAPIIVFVYNRPDHTKRTIEALKKNFLAEDSELYIFSDAPARWIDTFRVSKVRKYLKEVDGFKNISIIYQKRNLGLAQSIISGVTEIVNRFGRVIVLEDDMITSKFFLEFMNEALTIYESEKNVACIHAWNYPIESSMLPETFFLKGADCWGWGTWKRAWDIFISDGQILLNKINERNLQWEFDREGSYPYTAMLKDQIAGRNNSWAIRWHASAQLADMYCLHPGKSLIENIGLDGSGVHCGIDESLSSKVTQDKIVVKKQDVKLNRSALDLIKQYLTVKK